MSLSLALFCPSTGGHEEAVTTWVDTLSKPWGVTVDAETVGDSAGFLTKCDKFWRTCDAEIIGYLHSDLYMLEHGWDARILAEFEDKQVAVVGVVGALRLGSDDLYRTPYRFTQLARGDVFSNLTDWEVHGAKESGSRRVAVIDSCGVFVRRMLLARIGGWPVDQYPNSSHCSDLWLCCMAHRYGLNVRMVGVACQHRSGGKGGAGSQWLTDRGGDDKMHKAAHSLIYSQFRDVLPIRVST